MRVPGHYYRRLTSDATQDRDAKPRLPGYPMPDVYIYP